jgi:histidine ammonia-lyase
LEAAHALIREHARPWDMDRLFAPDLDAVKRLVLDGAFDRFVPVDRMVGG